MSNFITQQRVANYMGAISHLLSGRPHSHQAFIDGVELIVSGSEPHALQLMQFTERCRATSRPVLWIQVNPEVPKVPQIGLVVAIDGQTRVFENCMLWSASDGSRARLVPDSFTFGAYRFDDGLRLRHIAKAPAKTFKAAEPGMVRAYDRLIALEVAQLDRGEVFELPELARAA